MEKIYAKTPYGTLLGCRSAKIARFQGVPYAEPPLGERRFKPPVARRVSAEKIVNALEPGAAPPSPVRPAPPWMGNFVRPATNEDCLNLNVFTPGLDYVRRPVLVHVFGGGFESGSGSGGIQDGAQLAESGNCVVVRLNFRVGALGFLYLGQAWGASYEAGNLGVLDVVAALEWVQQNIQYLGGDPTNVTLFGISSGAFMIASLFGVPQSKGLFHKAWMQSGSVSRILDRAVASQMAADFLEILNIKPGDTAALQQVAVEKILDAQSKIVRQDVGARNAPGGRTLGVVADGYTLKEHPLAVLQRGDRRDIPLLLGTTRDETRLWFAMGVMGQRSWETLPQEFERYAGPERGQILFETYCRMLPEATPEMLAERFLTDAIYRVPAVRTALAQNEAGGQAFVYRFDWVTPYYDGKLGAFHGLDEAFVWGAVGSSQNLLVEDNPETRQVAEDMTGALFRFTATGNPGWPVYTPDLATTRIIDSAGVIKLAEVDSYFLTAWQGVERK